jgi:glycerophosphoryl diester phosphodiesterase
MYSPFLKYTNRPLILGHRGVPEEHQENTMAGFKRAIELGLDGVELDVFLTKDKKLAVFHDMDTERLTGIPGSITEMTWADIQQLRIKQTIDVGDKNIDYGHEEKVVLLEEVLEETRGKLLVDIEIKAYSLDFGQRHTGVAVANMIRRMGVESDVFITSFNFWPMLWLERTYPSLESGFTYSPMFVERDILRGVMELSFLGRLVGSTLTNMSLSMFDTDTLQKVQQQGMRVGAWTVFSQDSKWLGETILPAQEISHIRTLLSQGIDYFITDDPIRLRTLVSEERKRPCINLPR